MNPKNSQQALAQLQGIQKTVKDPNTILSQQRQQLGVNAAQDTATGLRGAIDNTTKLLKQVAPSVMGRTGNSLVTSAQANRIIQNEQAPISQNLTEQGTKYNQAQEDLNTLQQRAQEAASGIYQGQQDKLSYLQNLYNTLYQRETDRQAAKVAEQNRQEQIREFNAQLAESRRKSSGGGGISLGGFGTPTPTAKTNKTNPTQQQAYNDVATRIAKQADDALRSDYIATAKSARYGNKRDKYKLILYTQLRPDLFPKVSVFAKGV